MNNTLALVLAGAGAAGNAWQLGLIAGLHENGVDLTAADLIVGTSAGSTVAAQITSGTSPAKLYESILAEVIPSAPPRPVGPDYMAWSDELIAASTDVVDMRRRFGAAAIAKDDGAPSTRWHDIVASRLPSHEWPAQRMLIPAVNAETGEPVVFDRDSGVGLVDAVAASTSAMAPYRISDKRYLNGGYRRSSNADLAAGYDRVLILEPFSGRTRHPLEWGIHLDAHIAELRDGGSEVEAIYPDAGSGDVFNANALDPSTRKPAARGGHNQGRALADSLREFWS